MAETKVAIITAGGTGMGADAARKLAEDGFKVAILSSSGKGEALAEKLGGIGVTGSNRSNDDLKRLVDAAVSRWGRIDAAVNSAAHGPRAPMLELTDEDWHTGMEIYFLNAVRVARLVTPVMQAQNPVRSSTSRPMPPSSRKRCFRPPAFSVRGSRPSPNSSPIKYAADNVRMNNVLPGFIDSLPETGERRERIPMGRYGRVEEVSELIAFLASDKSSYITGQNIRIDGGITRSV